MAVAVSCEFNIPAEARDNEKPVMPEAIVRA
jgi:hypothetical protein